MNIFGEGQVESKIISWALVFGIVIILNLFFAVGISLVYEQPQYDQFCGSSEPVVKSIDTQEQCLEAGGQWVEHNQQNIRPQPIETPIAEGYCDKDFSCRKDFEEAREGYERNVFIVWLILGVLSVVGGIALKQHNVVSNGLTFGGILSFIIAAIGYWNSADDLIKLGMLGVALAVLIWIGVKKIKN